MSSPKARSFAVTESTMTVQINEALCKVLCHNLCVVIQSVHELGIETDFSEAEAA
jgi:hypothetical protein